MQSAIRKYRNTVNQTNHIESHYHNDRIGTQLCDLYNRRSQRKSKNDLANSMYSLAENQSSTATNLVIHTVSENCAADTGANYCT